VLRGLVSQESALCHEEPGSDQLSCPRRQQSNTNIFDGGVFVNLSLQIFKDAGL
jgi:hypothetical protein